MSVSKYTPRDDDHAAWWAKAIEELGELIVAMGKTQRFGPMSYNPELPEDEREMNYQTVLREIDDVREACNHVEYRIHEYLAARIEWPIQ